MPFKKPVQKFNAAINAVELGVGEKKIVLGGQNVMPFYTFDNAIENPPRIGVEISDLGFEDQVPGIRDFYAGCKTVADMAKKAAELEDVDFVCIRLDSADPNGENAPVADCVETARAVSEAIDKPLVIIGCDNDEKDAQLFEKVADALQGKNALYLSAKEENYKSIAAAVGLAYGQKVGAESSVDLNLAKQLNVLISQIGVDAKNIVMNIGTAASGYGFEYVISTLDRVNSAALSQNDAMLQMPIITPVSSETWAVKESTATEEDMPQWGSAETRGISMEVTTAVAVLASGSSAVILRHPTSIKTVAKLIKELI
ncbi:MAG: acetyl-CoA decarbonylase/synthase complex subunit delta [Clostridiales bacterium]|jgi:acetyl-CoA decarbonylase/synthase complex subunit delta|nr:acetyl-CoA decarbonylase/synthase complex subunit delta [Clostridiales bacterium]